MEARLERPPGYESGELPTAPLRDIKRENLKCPLSLFSSTTETRTKLTFL